MIEALIAYIQDKGFDVRVLPGMLLISEMINGQRLNLSWALSSTELASAHKEILFFEADQHLERLSIEARRYFLRSRV